jgi:hypothetical protein
MEADRGCSSAVITRGVVYVFSRSVAVFSKRRIECLAVTKLHSGESTTLEIV